jgi:hypothetical protein
MLTAVLLAILTSFLSAGVSEATVSTVEGRVNQDGTWYLGTVVRVSDQTTFSYESNNVPGCCLDLRFYSVTRNVYFCAGYNMGVGWYPIVGDCTSIIRGTRFRTGARNSVIRAGEDNYFVGRLFH